MPAYRYTIKVRTTLKIMMKNKIMMTRYHFIYSFKKMLRIRNYC